MTFISISVIYLTLLDIGNSVVLLLAVAIDNNWQN